MDKLVQALLINWLAILLVSSSDIVWDVPSNERGGGNECSGVEWACHGIKWLVASNDSFKPCLEDGTCCLMIQDFPCEFTMLASTGRKQDALYILGRLPLFADALFSALLAGAWSMAHGSSTDIAKGLLSVSSHIRQWSQRSNSAPLPTGLRACENFSSVISQKVWSVIYLSVKHNKIVQP
mgnify:FL=1